MRYEDLAVEVRPRDPWEALDLGVGMTRRWWRQTYAVWFALTLPVFVLTNLLLHDSPGWAFLLVWWLKPLYDRALLLVYSRAVFGQRNGLGEVLAALRQLLRGNSGLLLQLTLYRFDPSRALRLPIWQLEGLHRRDRGARYQVVARRGSGYATWLLLIGMHMEMFLQLSLVGLVWLFTPELVLQALWQQVWNALSNSDWPGWVALAANALYYLAMSAVEPLYVAGGFALYLNRRSELEGWDLEVAFRRIADRLQAGVVQPGAGVAAGSALLLAGLLATAVVWPGPARAADGARLAPDQSAQVIDQVLAAKDFGGERSVERWRLKDFADDDPRDTTDFSWNPGRFAELIEVLFWIAFAVAIGYVLLRVWRYSGPGRPSGPTAAPPAVVAGLDIRPESLPEDIAAEALRLWRLGQAREALSLAYRGALSALVHRHGIGLNESSTEGDVLQAARGRIEDPAYRQLGRLTALWQTQAYAHRRPDEVAVVELLTSWDRHFGMGEPNEPGGPSQGMPA